MEISLIERDGCVYVGVSLKINLISFGLLLLMFSYYALRHNTKHKTKKKLNSTHTKGKGREEWWDDELYMYVKKIRKRKENEDEVSVSCHA